MPQLPLPLSLPTVFSADNFFVSECNKAAYETVLDAKNWQGHALYLHGKKGSGKSHLSALFSLGMVLENIETYPDETELFYIFNRCKENGEKLLITSSLLPQELPFILPDLTSRLRSCQLASINAPDDAVLSAVMRKQFADRQLLVDEAVITYLIPRIERSFAGVKNLVETLDANALAEQRNITTVFAKRVLGF